MVNHNIKLSDLIPAGCSTYSKGDNCFPSNAPKYLVKGDGAYVWDDKGNKFLDMGMGLRSVILGHSYEEVNHAVFDAIMGGVNFTRPNLYEKQLAELMLDIFPWHDMVKFGKSGSDVTSAAVKLARAYTGRDQVMVARENPFISQHDWFINTTTVNGGIPFDSNLWTYSYDPMDFYGYNLSDVAAIILDPATVDITKEKLQYIRDLCDKHGCVMILDEIISGFRYGLTGVQGMFGIFPDLSTFGKAMGNGFSISALCGKREIMKLGDRDYGNVFLLSGTYNGETVGLAAAISTITKLYNNNGIFSRIDRIGKKLIKELLKKVEIYGLEEVMTPRGFSIDNHLIGSNPSITFSSPEVKTIFDQHMVECNILMPYIAPSYSHTDSDMENVLCAADYSMKMLSQAIKSSGDLVKKCFDGHIEKSVFR